MPFVTDEIVTAAKLNLATGVYTSKSEVDRSGWTNTAFADLDALTAGTGTMTAVAVTVTTGTVVLVIVSANAFRNNTASTGAFLGWRVSGATTIAASDSLGLRNYGATGDGSNTFIWPQVVTAGVNTFELQARVPGGTGRIINAALTVMTFI